MSWSGAIRVLKFHARCGFVLPIVWMMVTGAAFAQSFQPPPRVVSPEVSADHHMDGDWLKGRGIDVQVETAGAHGWPVRRQNPVSLLPQPFQKK